MFTILCFSNVYMCLCSSIIYMLPNNIIQVYTIIMLILYHLYIVYTLYTSLYVYSVSSTTAGSGTSASTVAPPRRRERNACM